MRCFAALSLTLVLVQHVGGAQVQHVELLRRANRNILSNADSDRHSPDETHADFMKAKEENEDSELSSHAVAFEAAVADVEATATGHDDEDGEAEASEAIQLSEDAEDEIEDEIELDASPVPKRNASLRRDEIGVVAWVDFRETGAATLEAIFAERHRRNGWSGTANSSAEGMCKAKEEKLDIVSEETLAEEDDEVVQMPKCSDLQDGAVVGTHYGYCDLLKGARPCRYVTLFREPMERLLASYNYFCKTCNEKTCPGEKNRNKNTTCPDMSVVEYARRIGNEYVRMFAGQERPCLVGHPCERTPLHGKTLEDEEDYRKAVAALTEPNVLVLFLESLFEDREERGLTRGTKYLTELFGTEVGDFEVPRKNHTHRFWPSKEQRSELTDILQLDIRLYAALKMRPQPALSGNATNADASAITPAAASMSSGDWDFLRMSKLHV